MSNTLLRIMTAKSKIGFGEYSLLTVQELLNLGKYKELIQMYYRLEKIDFCQEVKEELRIIGKRVIPKPSRNYDAYHEYIFNMINEIHDIKGTFNKDNPDKWKTLHDMKGDKKRYVVSNCIRQNKEKSKMLNKNRNQK